ncbi:MAG: baseplate J/gp47 family protein [Methanobrevibacter sp.]|nr:baseplate J/gp47 family protein [Methanobrevibacter sp.]
MTYVRKYYKEIFLKALNEALKQSLISHQEEFERYVSNKQDISNFYVMLLSIHSEIFEQVYSDMTEVYFSDKINHAIGSDLDDIGLMLGIPRPQATRASVEVTFTLNHDQDTDVLESPGILVTTQNGISYRTVEELYIPTGELTGTVNAVAVNPGTGSIIIENQISKLESDLSSTQSSTRVNNGSASSGGREGFNDEEYRLLLKHHKEIFQKGNEWAFINYLDNFDGLDGYSFIPNWDGSGTIKIILDPGTDYQLGQAYNDLQSQISQASEDICMTAPVKIPINVYAVVDVDIDRVNPYSSNEKEEIKSKIVSAIKLFIDGGKNIVTGEYHKGLSIGEDFIPYKLGAFLDKQIPELKNITFNVPENYITITDEEIGTANIITIEMV